MYHLFLEIQFIGIVILFIEFYYLFHQKPSRDQMLLLIFSICGVINSVGYLFEMLAVRQDAAILAVKVTYIGKVYIPYTMLLFVMDFCRCRLGKHIEKLLFLAHTGILVLVLTCEQHSLFYTDISYVQTGMFPHLVLGHGIFYRAYLVLILVYMFGMPLACLWRYRKIKDKKERSTLVTLCTVTLIPMLGYLVFLAGVTKGYDTTAFCYALSSILLLLLIFRHNILNLLDVARDELVENLSEGMIVFDNTGELVYANPSAKQIVGKVELEKNPRELQESLQRWKNTGQPRMMGESYYQPEVREIRKNERTYGKLWVLSDVTASFRYTNQLEADVKEKTREITVIQHKVITSLATLIGVRDDDTGSHVRRTSGVVGILARELAKSSGCSEILDEDMIQDIVDAAPLHDIGKIAIPDRILQKPGRLTPEEYEIIKTHAEIGGKMLEEVLEGVENDQYLSIARGIAYYHHERWDGKGYPSGLSGKNIPLPARIMAVSDVYDALVSPRVYKAAMSTEQAYQIIIEGSGTQFDPEIVKAFEKEFTQIKKLYQKYEVSWETKNEKTGGAVSHIL